MITHMHLILFIKGSSKEFILYCFFVVISYVKTLMIKFWMVSDMCICKIEKKSKETCLLIINFSKCQSNPPIFTFPFLLWDCYEMFALGSWHNSNTTFSQNFDQMKWFNWINVAHLYTLYLDQYVYCLLYIMERLYEII